MKKKGGLIAIIIIIVIGVAAGIILFLTPKKKEEIKKPKKEETAEKESEEKEEEKKKKSYRIGDRIVYHDTYFYVIKDSDEEDDKVTLLKNAPLTYDEVNQFGQGHINMYNTSKDAEYYQKSDKVNGNFGGVAYYSSATCGIDENRIGNQFVSNGCTTSYDNSEVKYIIDQWASNLFDEGVLTEDELGYQTRMLTIEDLTIDLGYSKDNSYLVVGEDTPKFMRGKQYNYWTMSSYQKSSDGDQEVYVITTNGGGFGGVSVTDHTYAIRPVVTLKKSALEE